MKHILVGTAGHVDHGKTSLIQALTGIDADRLKEEKQRGITIDIGFAYMKLPDGGLASIVDVPGHERFIKNMLAGAGGIDLVLLVVAADDGVMPQTREHLSILELLNAKSGIIALTKCDLVDSEWQTLVTEDIKSFAADTFLQDAPIIPVSSHTGKGIEALRKTLIKKIESAPPKSIESPPRLHVDRAFSMDGFGTVVTGTLIEGTIHRGDAILIYPKQISAKIRHIQVHDQDVETAYAGQRVAVNLAGVKRDEVARGNTIAAEGSLINTRMLDVKLSAVKDSPREIKTGSKLHFYYGTESVLCKAVLLGKKSLPPGGECYAQLRFAEEVAVKRGDPFVLRFYSPMETIGGGVILKEDPRKFRQVRLDESVKALESLEHGGTAEQIEQAIDTIANLNEIKKRFALDDETWQQEIEFLTNNGRIYLIGNNHAITAGYKENLGKQMHKLLSAFHTQNPLQSGMRKEELRSRVFQKRNPSLFDSTLALFNELTFSGEYVALKNFVISYTKEQTQIRKAIQDKVRQGAFSPPPVDELLAVYQKGARKTALQVLDSMLNDGILILTEAEMVFHRDVVEQGIGFLKEIGSDITLAQFRDKAGTSRKFALSLLDYYDRQKITRKTGDVRFLL